MDWRHLFLAAALVAPSMTALADGRRIESVVFDLQQTVGGQTLQLNGAGVRKKLIFKAAAIAFYATKPIRQASQVWETPGPKRIKTVALRDIDASGLGKVMSQTMNDNLPRDRMGPCIPGLIKLGDVFSEKKRIAAGESFTLDDVPGQGTVLSINDQPTAVIEGSAFFGCLMYNYFGERPADAALKQALLEPDAGTASK